LEQFQFPTSWLDQSRTFQSRTIVQIRVTARHGHLNDEHQQQITEKASKLLHYFERLTFIEVVVDLSKKTKSVEVLGDTEHKHDIVATAEADDLMTAVRAAVEKFKHQLNHYKERVQDHRRDPSHGGEEGIKP
jgi:putative sigma-54 modulation protein